MAYTKQLPGAAGWTAIKIEGWWYTYPARASTNTSPLPPSCSQIGSHFRRPSPAVSGRPSSLTGKQPDVRNE
ncbi:hypothetical protein SNOG_02550 [Parastagonospora nodorum SN15]|uniref:Uncharacterized protein n=1 Tax=Phaeosphaeria nodorum (strain SN15 / ATCC MYA-4574 / FGSC 10173) TaxID=321614 RepID=Q0V0B4_PHANO|nr:hypothetical protein SNOG_02550 [Parastagonospora nodorum SN15]EAT90762.1 hypothetical protein SNOG_02550 [Parastagonospora nodorum SN15]